MDSDIKIRILREAEYIANSGDTLRSTAEKMGISKSTVHKDMAKRLQYIDRELYDKVRKVTENNKSLRHIRGGEATRDKYLRMRMKVEE
ncbi:MAG: stage III sporulation protein D [Anaerofustis stercorihominis]|nr:stage III sporulation protein D [Anaerofustis stercorihominis]